MIKSLIFITLLLSLNPAWGQYYPRGTSLNDGYLPNLDEPDKWMVGIDGMFDWQKEQYTGSQTSFQTVRGQFHLFYGGQVFRGGVQVIHDSNRAAKDLSVGLGISYNRPVFIDLGIGYLNRLLNNRSFTGTSYLVKVGYNVNWIMQVKYRVRFRLALVYNHKDIDNSDPSQVSNFYPMVGIEFET